MWVVLREGLVTRLQVLKEAQWLRVVGGTMGGKGSGFLRICNLLVGKGGGGLICPVVELGRGGVCFLVGVVVSLLFSFQGGWAFCVVLCLELVERP